MIFSLSLFFLTRKLLWGMNEKSLNSERGPLQLNIYDKRASFSDSDEFCKHLKYKTKHVLTKQPNNCPPEHLPPRKEILCLHKNLYMIALSSFICNTLKLERTKMILNRWMVILKYIHTVECYSAMQRSKLLIFMTAWIDLKDSVLSEKVNLITAYSIWFHLYVASLEW